MKVINVKEVEDCFDGSFIKEVFFDEAVTEEFIYYLREIGQLQYFPNFPRPFYNVENKGMYIVKGIQGNKTARIILNRKKINANIEHFNNFVRQYKINNL